jgi:predicted ATPase
MMTVLKAPPTPSAPLDALTSLLAARPKSLVILDNFEQLLGSDPGWLETLLVSAAQVTFLVTSREVLGLRAEHVAPIRPLEPAEAIDLFVDRAVAGVRADDPATAALVEWLERIPLALELAAARTRILPLADILTRLQDRFALLRRRGRGRHSTMWGTIDWSWALLSEPERDALSALSLLEGGISVPSAQAVIGTADVIDLLQDLRDKSLLLTNRAAGAVGIRLGMFASIREYVSRTRPPGAATRRRFVEHFAQLGDTERLNDFHEAPDTLAGQALEAELENLLAAAELGQRAGMSEEAGRAGLAAVAISRKQGRVHEGQALADALLAHVLSPRLRAELTAARFTKVGMFSSGDHREEVLALIPDASPRTQAQSYLYFSLKLYWFVGLQDPDVLRLAQEGLRIAREHHLAMEQVRAEAMVLRFEGRHAEAERVLLRGLDLVGEQQRRTHVDLLQQLQRVRTHLLRLDEAWRCAEQAVALAERLGDQTVLREVLSLEYDVYWRAGMLDAGRDNLLRQRQLNHDTAAHDLELKLYVDIELAWNAGMRGDIDGAQARFEALEGELAGCSARLRGYAALRFADVLALKPSAWQQAISLCDACIEIYKALMPIAPGPQSIRAELLSRLGRHAEAVDVLEPLVALAAEQSAPYNWLRDASRYGQVLVRLGRHEEAAALFAQLRARAQEISGLTDRSPSRIRLRELARELAAAGIATD